MMSEIAAGQVWIKPPPAPVVVTILKASPAGITIQHGRRWKVVLAPELFLEQGFRLAGDPS